MCIILCIIGQESLVSTKSLQLQPKLKEEAKQPPLSQYSEYQFLASNDTNTTVTLPSASTPIKTTPYVTSASSIKSTTKTTLQSHATTSETTSDATTPPHSPPQTSAATSVKPSTASSTPATSATGSTKLSTRSTTTSVKPSTASNTPATSATGSTKLSTRSTTTSIMPASTTSTKQPATTAGTMPATTSTGSITVATSSVSTNVPTTDNYTTTTPPTPVCPDGKFGHGCAYTCRCLKETEVCDKTTGFCPSGCLNGWSGPGCLIEDRGGVPSAVVVLAILLASFIFITCGLCVYLGAYRAVKKRRQDQYAARAGEEAYDFTDMSNRAYPEPPYAALSSKVPRIRETDIKVMSDVLGEGRYGEIFRGYLTTNKNMPVAFKTLKPDATEFEKTGFINQLELHSILEPNPNIIDFHGVCLVGDQIYAAFEYAPKSNLRNFLRTQAIKDKEDLDEPEVLSRERLLEFAFDVASGMNYLANKQIIHKELMTRHVLVGDGYVAKISGLNSQNTAGQNLHVRWLAPEAIKFGQYSIQSDIWSFGVVLWEIMTQGEKPYPGKATKDLPEELEKGYRMNQPNNCEDSVYQLMQWCWQSDADQRPAFPLLVDALRDLIENGKTQMESPRRATRDIDDLSEEEPLD